MVNVDDDTKTAWRERALRESIEAYGRCVRDPESATAADVFAALRGLWECFANTPELGPLLVHTANLLEAQYSVDVSSLGVDFYGYYEGTKASSGVACYRETSDGIALAIIAVDYFVDVPMDKGHRFWIPVGAHRAVPLVQANTIRNEAGAMTQSIEQAIALDRQWADEELRNSPMSDWDGDYLGIVDQKVRADGYHDEEVRKEAAKQANVSPERVVVVYRGPLP